MARSSHTHSFRFPVLQPYTPPTVTPLHTPSCPRLTPRGHPAEVTLRDPAHLQSRTWHLARTSHILSHPHSLSPLTPPPSSPVPPPTLMVRRQQTGSVPPQGGTRWLPPCPLESGAPTSLLPFQAPTLPSQGQTDRHIHTLSRSYTHAPLWQPHGSSLFLIMGQCACLLTQLEMVRE